MFLRLEYTVHIRESVDTLGRDGTDGQYVQYLTDLRKDLLPERDITITK